MQVRVHGLAPREGDAAFAFLVLRLAIPVDRAGLIELVHRVAPLVPGAERFVEGLPDNGEAAMRLVGIPWLPPEVGHDLDMQRRLIEGAGRYGVEEAWFFQTGTSLPMLGDGDAARGHDGDAARGASEAPGASAPHPATRRATTDDGWDELDLGDDPGGALPVPRAKIETAADRGGVGEVAVWSHGPLPQATEVRFPVDGYPEIVEELDVEDFGIAFKLAGPWTPGESTVMLGFHAMWLVPYGGRYRNAAVTIDQRHHAVHLWVDRFVVPCSPREQVHHLLWVVSKLDEVTPILHARFGGATMAQKYGGLLGDSEPFVLGGNPLLAVHAAGGERGVDTWIAAQTEWSNEELAHMLRELAIDLVTRPARSAEAVAHADGRGAEAPGGDDDVDAMFEAAGIGVGDTDDADRTGQIGAAALDAVAGGQEGDEGEGSGAAREDDAHEEDGAARDEPVRTRRLTSYAGELLAARAAAGTLDPRVAEKLRPVLAAGEKHEHRRTAAVSVLGALRDRGSVPAMIRLLEATPLSSSVDAIGNEDLLTATVAAMGAIADPVAIPVLSKLVSAPGAHNDEPRAAAASALAACLAAAPARPELGDAIFAAMARSLGERGDDEYLAEVYLAYGSLAGALPPARRDAARQHLIELEPELDDDGDMVMLARRAALVLMAGGAGPDAESAAALRVHVHAALTELGYDHDATIRKVRVALRVAARWPDLVDPPDLVWLTRLSEPDVRARAHELLARMGQPMPPAAAFDRRAARALPDHELVRWIGEPHVIGRAALVAEAGRRKLAATRPAILGAAHAVIDHARRGGKNLLAPQARLLEAAVAALRGVPLAPETVALFDRMLRHSNHHVKWELLQAPPRDERLIGGMLHVLDEGWGWQETTAQEWLAHYAGTSAYEAERRRATVPAAHEDDGAAAWGRREEGPEEDDDHVN